MKKTICLFLIALICFSVFASCETVEPNESETKSTSSAEANSEAESEVAGYYGQNIPVKDLDERVIRVLCRDFGSNSKSIIGFHGEIIQRDTYSEDTASFVDVKKREVLNTVEELYNCKFKGEFYSEAAGDLNAYVKNLVVSLDPSAPDIVFDAYGRATPLILENVYADLTSVETINFSNPWWDQNARENLSIDNKLYFMLGDINTYDNDGTWVLFFNKDMKDEFSIEQDFYDMAEKGSWTFDEFTQIVKSITFDSDANGVVDEFDTWGLGTETYNIYIHTVAGGQKIVTKDENDLPLLNIENTANVETLLKVLDFYNDNSVMIANGGKFDARGYANIWEETIIKAFREGRELFYLGGLMNAPGFRDVEHNIGILPIPKMSAEQDTYFHSVSFHNMSCMLFTTITDDFDDLGLVVEKLAAESKNKVTPEYYDRTLKYKDFNDDESGVMLDIIFASRSYDLGAAFNWGGVLNQYFSLDKNVTSRMESIEPAVQDAIDKTVDFLKNN